MFRQPRFSPVGIVPLFETIDDPGVAHRYWRPRWRSPAYRAMVHARGEIKRSRPATDLNKDGGYWPPTGRCTGRS